MDNKKLTMDNGVSILVFLRWQNCHNNIIIQELVTALNNVHSTINWVSAEGRGETHKVVLINLLLYICFDPEYLLMGWQYWPGLKTCLEDTSHIFFHFLVLIITPSASNSLKPVVRPFVRLSVRQSHFYARRYLALRRS